MTIGLTLLVASEIATLFFMTRKTVSSTSRQSPGTNLPVVVPDFARCPFLNR